jgi:hypothetical protein
MAPSAMWLPFHFGERISGDARSENAHLGTLAITGFSA